MRPEERVDALLDEGNWDFGGSDPDDTRELLVNTVRAAEEAARAEVRKLREVLRGVVALDDWIGPHGGEYYSAQRTAFDAARVALAEAGEEGK